MLRHLACSHTCTAGFQACIDTRTLQSIQIESIQISNSHAIRFDRELHHISALHIGTTDWSLSSAPAASNTPTQGCPFEDSLLRACSQSLTTLILDDVELNNSMAACIGTMPSLSALGVRLATGSRDSAIFPLWPQITNLTKLQLHGTWYLSDDAVR